MTQTSARHSNQFTEKNCVFQARDNGKKVEVIVENWNDKQKTFNIYLDGQKVTASTNYPKAIGIALLTLNETA